MIRAGLGLALLCAAPAVARDIQLSFPVDCVLGQDCYIQQYVDHAEGSLARDFQCSSLTYDGHQGTDIALPTLAAMEAGTSVVAAAPGVVVATRDGMEDKTWSPEDPDLDGKDCGNRVAIRHGNGWITDHCHLRQGSVAVSKGDRVAIGTKLGLIGMSGRAQFPHLHFSVQKDNQIVDPFDPDGDVYCTAPSGDTLWADPIPYRAGGLIGAGFATSKSSSSYEAMKQGTAQSLTQATNPDNLILWSYLFGLKFGDELNFRVAAPDGALLEDTTVLLQRNRALSAQRMNIPRPDPGWPNQISATITVIRAGEAIDITERSISLN